MFCKTYYLLLQQTNSITVKRQSETNPIIPLYHIVLKT